MVPWLRYMWKEEVVSPHYSTGTGNQTAPLINNNFCLVWLACEFSAQSGIRGESSGVAALEQNLARHMFASLPLPLEEWESLWPHGGGESILPLPSVQCWSVSSLCFHSAPASCERSPALEVKIESVSERSQPKPYVPAHETQVGASCTPGMSEWGSECMCVRVRCWFPRRF